MELSLRVKESEAPIQNVQLSEEYQVKLNVQKNEGNYAWG